MIAIAITRRLFKCVCELNCIQRQGPRFRIKQLEEQRYRALSVPRILLLRDIAGRSKRAFGPYVELRRTADVQVNALSFPGKCATMLPILKGY